MYREVYYQLSLIVAVAIRRPMTGFARPRPLWASCVDTTLARRPITAEVLNELRDQLASPVRRA